MWLEIIGIHRKCGGIVTCTAGIKSDYIWSCSRCGERAYIGDMEDNPIDTIVIKKHLIPSYDGDIECDACFQCKHGPLHSHKSGISSCNLFQMADQCYHHGFKKYEEKENDQNTSK